MAVRITLFGKLGELIGRELEFVNTFQGRTLTDVRQFLAQEHPCAASELLSPRLRAYVNDTSVIDNHVVTEGDEIALLPPVSGG